MTLTQLRAFLLAASLGSFTAAARTLGTSQPTVSELVRKLEDEVGLTLLVRDPRGMTLTPAGTELLPWARRTVESADGAAEAMRGIRGVETGEASLGMMRNAPYYRLSELAEAFHRARPGVRLRLVGQNSSEVAEAVRRGHLEAGLCILPIDDEGLQVSPLVRTEVYWVSSVRRTGPATMDRLARVPLILYDAHYATSDPTRRQLTERAQAAGVRLHPIVEVEHVESALGLVARGLGDTIASAAVTGHPSFPAGLHTRSFADRLFDRVALVTRRQSALSPATTELVRMATEMLRR